MKRFTECSLKNKRTPLLFYPIALVALLFALLLGAMVGSASLSVSEVFRAFLDVSAETPEGRILWYARVPRTLASLLAGGALALSGAVIQGTLGNRLASPGVIGVNAGAGFAVTLCSAFGILGGFRLSLLSFLGAFLTVLLVSVVACRFGASRSTVILTGVALNSLLGAASDAVGVLVPDVASMSAAFRMGDFSSVGLTRLIPAAVIILPTALLLFILFHEFDVLTLGEDIAHGLGLSVGRVRLLFLVLSALLAGSAVSMAGQLAFVGLLVPHAVRRCAGTGAKHHFPLCFLFGGAFVSLCDTLSRVLFAPYEIPVGIPMALIGAPFFLFLLFRKKGGECDA